ncbi:MAG: LPS assembly protein LptD [Alphaproteobacteria bacterium]|nr:LPS assembly protein LptD [Alphaproteobacteria bacterium]
MALRTRALLLAATAAALIAAPSHAANKLVPKGDGNVLLRADEVVYDINASEVTAQGNVEVDYNGQILIARKVIYDQKTDTVKAVGDVSVLTPDGNVAFANEVTLKDQMRDGILEGFSAYIGENGRLAAAHATRTGGVKTVASRAAYTPCKICNQPGQRTPLWQVKAYRVVYDQNEHRIRFQDAILEAFGIPILYTPYFSLADPSVKRETGLLAPSLGSSSSLGQFIQLPLYVSLTDSRDFTIAPTITTEGGELLRGEYRERWQNGGMWLQPSIAYNPKGGLAGTRDQTYSSLFGSGRVGITDTWTAGYDVQLSSNDTFLKRYDISTEDRLVSDLFVEGIQDRSRFAISGFYFQGLRSSDKPSTIPFVLPMIEYTYIPQRKLFGGQFRFDLNTLSLERSFGADSQRVSAEIHYRLPFVTANGQLISFIADMRGDAYRVSNDDPAALDTLGKLLPMKTRYITRGLPYATLEWRWPFISGANGNALVVEPIMQLIAAPYGGNPSGIPNEDSADFELDETDIFRSDRLPGYDIWEPGPRANFGLRTEAYFSKGSVELLLGESIRLKPIKLFPVNSGLDGKRSDVVGRLTIKFPPHLSLTHRVDIDQSNGSIRRNEVYLDSTFGRSSLTVSYVRLNQKTLTLGLNPREEVNGEAVAGITDHWSLFAGARRDLEKDQMLDTEYGIGYDDECLRFSVSYLRKFTRDRDVPPSTSILFRIKLKTDDKPDTPSDLFPRHIFTTP